MKRLLLLLSFSMLTGYVFSQTAEIRNTRLQLSVTADTLVVRYDLYAPVPVVGIRLEVIDSLGRAISATSLAGDLGDGVVPGTDKTIYWAMRRDAPQVYGSNIYVTVTAAALYYPVVAEDRYRYFPWLLVASGACAITGGYAWYQAEQLYRKYPDADLTDPAEQYYADVLRYDRIRNVAFTAAAAFGVTGTVVHMRHMKKKRALTATGVPLPGGGMVAIRYQF